MSWLANWGKKKTKAISSLLILKKKKKKHQYETIYFSLWCTFPGRQGNSGSIRRQTPGKSSLAPSLSCEHACPQLGLPQGQIWVWCFASITLGLNVPPAPHLPAIAWGIISGKKPKRPFCKVQWRTKYPCSGNDSEGWTPHSSFLETCRHAPLYPFLAWGRKAPWLKLSETVDRQAPATCRVNLEPSPALLSESTEGVKGFPPGSTVQPCVLWGAPLHQLPWLHFHSPQMCQIWSLSDAGGRGKFQGRFWVVYFSHLQEENRKWGVVIIEWWYLKINYKKE